MLWPFGPPDLLTLEVFVTTVRLGSLTRAAAAHGISQPAASNRIRALEHRLGVRVLVRTTRGSVPTPEGSLIANWADEVLSAVGHLGAGVEALRARHTERLRVVASFTAAEYLLPPRLERLRRRHPTEAIQLEVANSSIVLQRVSSGQADLGFIESPGSVRGLTTAVVGEDRLVLVVPPGHRWAQRKVVPIDVVASTPLVLRELGSGTREALAEGFAEGGQGLPIAALELGSTAAVKAAVMSGSGPAVLSDMAVRGDIDAGLLVAVPVRGLSIRRQLRAVWRSSPGLTAAAAALVHEAEA